MCSTSMFLFITPNPQTVKFEFKSHEYLKQEEVIFKCVSSWYFFIVKTFPLMHMLKHLVVMDILMSFQFT